MHKFKIIGLLVLISTVTGCFPVRTQDRSAVDFYIKDETGRPIPDAEVFVMNHPNAIQWDGNLLYSDERGNASLSSSSHWILAVIGFGDRPPFPIMDWCVEMQGYQSQTGSIRVDGGSKTIRLTLHASNINMECEWSLRHGLSTESR